MKNLIWILAAIMLAGCGDNEEGQDMGLHGDPPGYSTGMKLRCTQ